MIKSDLDQVDLQEYPRIAVLRQAKETTLGDRQDLYGDFKYNMDLQGTIMTLLMEAGLDSYNSAHNTAISYVVGKLVRIAQGKLHFDNYVDAVNYIAAAYECEVS